MWKSSLGVKLDRFYRKTWCQHLKLTVYRLECTFKRGLCLPWPTLRFPFHVFVFYLWFKVQIMCAVVKIFVFKEFQGCLLINFITYKSVVCTVCVSNPLVKPSVAAFWVISFTRLAVVLTVLTVWLAETLYLMFNLQPNVLYCWNIFVFSSLGKDLTSCTYIKPVACHHKQRNGLKIALFNSVGVFKGGFSHQPHGERECLHAQNKNDLPQLL